MKINMTLSSEMSAEMSAEMSTKTADVGKTAIVLVGGKSRRMGDDKSMLPGPAGGPGTILEGILQQLEDYFDEIIISTSEPGRHQLPNYRTVVDENPGQGPLMGILAGLRASVNAVNFVVACDIPEINGPYLERLLALATDYDIVVPVSGEEKYEPLFAVYNKRVIPVVEETLAAGSRKIIVIYDKCKTKYIKMEPNQWYKNLNTPGEYSDYMTKVAKVKQLPPNSKTDCLQ
ncbi:MAG: molybdenum cofactor guanylyltransferase [bacterium]|nr:molybdenum cofactor guanylyltransferase [bacterium]